MIDRPDNSLGKRIRLFRAAAGMTQATLAEQMGVTRDAVSQWEAGDSTPKHQKFHALANALNVSVSSLADDVPTGIPLRGLVGAGATIDWRDEMAFQGHETIEWPGNGHIAALRVVGDSQYPRFLSGEIVLFDQRPVLPEAVVNDYAVIETGEGTRLLKIVRREMPRGYPMPRWTLESHNAPPITNVMVIAAYRYLGTLAAPDSAPPKGRKR